MAGRTGPRWGKFTEVSRKPYYTTPHGAISGEDLSTMSIKRTGTKSQLWHKSPDFEIMVRIGRDWLSGVPVRAIIEYSGYSRKTIYRLIKRLDLPLRRHNKGIRMAARNAGINVKTVVSRIQRGWTLERALLP